jgi:pantothenate kinase
MAETYNCLAARVAAAANARGGEPLWVAIAGGPGAGKSTLAAAVAARCARDYGVPAMVLPMDGFHYSRAELCALDPPAAAAFLPRRGAPHTFDAAGLLRALTAAKVSRAATLPTYSRELSDPVPGGAELLPAHKVVLVEGNYLLLGLLASGPHRAQAAGGLSAEEVAIEARRWLPLLPLFDETWFVAPAAGVPEQRRRLVGRHLETWSAAKTAAWGASCATEGAEKRSDFNDVPNAYLVDGCRPLADLQISSV